MLITYYTSFPVAVTIYECFILHLRVTCSLTLGLLKLFIQRVNRSNRISQEVPKESDKPTRHFFKFFLDLDSVILSRNPPGIGIY